MTQTLGPEQLTATTIDSSQETLAPGADIISRIAMEQCVSIALHEQAMDQFQTHKDLMSNIDMICKFTGEFSDSEIIESKQNIQTLAIDLAAQILPPDVRKAYHLQATIPDTAGYHHPPTKNEVSLLAEAWDVTGSRKLRSVLAAAIEELADYKDVVYMRGVLQEAETSGSKFSTVYRNLEVAIAEVDFDLDKPTTPKTYIVFGNDSTPTHSYPDGIYVSEPSAPLAEENERFVGTRIVSMDESLVLFDPNSSEILKNTTPRLYTPHTSPVTYV